MSVDTRDINYWVQQAPYGWKTLIESTNTQLESLVPGYEIHLVKEKFGGLRFYYSVPDGFDDVTRDLAQDIVYAAEEASYKTCEECSEPAQQRTEGYWIRTLCDECWERRDR